MLLNDVKYFLFRRFCVKIIKKIVELMMDKQEML